MKSIRIDLLIVIISAIGFFYNIGKFSEIIAGSVNVSCNTTKLNSDVPHVKTFEELASDETILSKNRQVKIDSTIFGLIFVSEDQGHIFTSFQYKNRHYNLKLNFEKNLINNLMENSEFTITTTINTIDIENMFAEDCFGEGKEYITGHSKVDITGSLDSVEPISI
ncbi:MAG: hypothetical protein K9I71_01270 [Ignavibacteriales bacterium]|nr:hypothetical protein [Ignavibacteriales bacterium]MCF8314718.1 hypothetical protein [Ignavibacteriales bacterium]MCF8438034.1 hypothetical protein [Ignavibacteriales bacterium]